MKAKTEILNTKPVKMVEGVYRVTLDLGYSDACHILSGIKGQVEELTKIAKVSPDQRMKDLFTAAACRLQVAADAFDFQTLITSKKLQVGKPASMNAT